MPLATMRQIIKIGESDANLDQKNGLLYQHFKLPLKISTLATAMIAAEILFLCGIIINRIDS